MAKVTGLGGVFLRCRDHEAQRQWYAQHLGIQVEPWGAQFNYTDDPHPQAYSTLGFFKASSEYFQPSQSGFMINFRVDDLDALYAQLREAGVTLVGEPVAEEYGKFAWIMDPEGNKIELWEQPK
jgi:predicted enzyme related to lactoylglutathione lyase